MGKGKPRAGEVAVPPPNCWMCSTEMCLDSNKEGKKVYYCEKCGTETEVRRTG